MAQRFEDRERSDVQRIFDAAKNGDTTEVEMLLDQGISLDIRDSKERTLLMWAAEGARADLVEALVKRGADLDAVDADEGETALMTTSYSDHLVEVAKLLVTNGAAVQLRNDNGLTALEIAREMGATEVADFLSMYALTPGDFVEAEQSPEPDPDNDGPAAPAAMDPVPETSEIESGHPEIVSESGAGQFEERQDEELLDEDESAVAGDSLAVRGGQPDAAPKTTRARRDVVEKKTGTGLALPADILAAGEQRIIFDEWDNRQIRSINEKTRKVLDKAGREIGDHTIDTVFKGSHMAVLKPRSQEYKRFRKLWKHQELLIDPRRWREFTGGAAVRRYCLGEGIDVSSLSGSHLIELYSVKDLTMILTLAEDAITRNYTIRQLKQAIEEIREQKDDLDPGKVIIKTLDQSVPILDDPDLAELCTDKERVLQELSKAERKKTRSLLKQRKPNVDEWKSLMDTLEGILSDLEDE
jgi:uncharacterized protein